MGLEESGWEEVYRTVKTRSILRDERGREEGALPGEEGADA